MLTAKVMKNNLSDCRFLFIMLAAFLSLSVTSCKKTPDWVLDKDDMASLLVDIHKGESVIEYERSRYHNDSLKKVMKQSVYAKHGVTAGQVDTSFVWYGNHIEDYIEVYDMVIDQLEDELTRSDATIEVPVFAAGDSIDIWSGSPRYRINPSMKLGNISFLIDTDENSEAGDNYMLQLKVINHRFISSGGVKCGLYAEYDDGMIESKTATATGDGWLRVRLMTDSVKGTKAVYGNISFDIDDNSGIFYLDSLSLVRTRINPAIYFQRSNQRHFDMKKAGTADE